MLHTVPSSVQRGEGAGGTRHVHTVKMKVHASRHSLTYRVQRVESIVSTQSLRLSHTHTRLSGSLARARHKRRENLPDAGCISLSRTRLLGVCPKTTVYKHAHSGGNGVVEHRGDSVRRVVANHLLRDEVCGPRCARAVFSRARPQARWRWAQHSRLRLHEGNVVATNIITARRKAPYCRGRSAPAVLDRIRRSSSDWYAKSRELGIHAARRCAIGLRSPSRRVERKRPFHRCYSGCLLQFLTVPRSRRKAAAHFGD